MLIKDVDDEKDDDCTLKGTAYPFCMNSYSVLLVVLHSSVCKYSNPCIFTLSATGPWLKLFLI